MQISYKSVLTVGVFTLLSRLLGFVRDLIIARMFGANGSVDAFLVAFKLPNLLRRLFVDGAFNLGLIPVLSAYQKRDTLEFKQFINNLTGALLAFLIPATIFSILIAPGITAILAPGFITDTPQFWFTNTLLVIILPYLPLITLTACAGAVLQIFTNFWVAAFTPMLLNISLIIAALYGGVILPQQPVMALAWGTIIAGVLQLLLQIPFLWRLGIVIKPHFASKELGLRRLRQIIAPALFGTSITQLNFMLDGLLLSFLPAGSISWLYYANRLIEFPQGVLGAALGTVILPKLSTYYQHNDTNNFSKTLDTALRWSLITGLPAAAGLWLLAQPIITTLFQSERFTMQDVKMAAMSLEAYSIGLPAYLIVKVLTPGYYARQVSDAPVRIAVICGIINLILSLSLMWPLAHVGLAWSSSITAYLNVVLLWYGLISKNIYVFSSDWLIFLLRITVACAIMLWILSMIETENLLLLILKGMTVYVISLFLLGLRIQHVRN